MKNILSLGAGVQSSTLALMFATGEISPRVDAAIFADTMAEPKSVYDWLDWLDAEIQNSAFPFPVCRVSAGDLEAATLRVRVSGKSGLNYLKPSVPVFMDRPTGGGMMGRACTMDYKITPLLREAKRICGINRGQKEVTVTTCIGISRDEMGRMKESREPWCRHRWPLVELGMNRQACVDWMAARGYPTPPRSACVFCPYHSNAEWRRLKADEPDGFERAVKYEIELQKSMAQISRLDGVPYLHNSRRLLTDVDFSEPQTDQMQFEFGIQNECEGMCGV